MWINLKLLHTWRYEVWKRRFLRFLNHVVYLFNIFLQQDFAFCHQTVCVCLPLSFVSNFFYPFLSLFNKVSWFSDTQPPVGNFVSVWFKDCHDRHLCQSLTWVHVDWVGEGWRGWKLDDVSLILTWLPHSHSFSSSSSSNSSSSSSSFCEDSLLKWV